MDFLNYHRYKNNRQITIHANLKLLQPFASRSNFYNSYAIFNSLAGIVLYHLASLCCLRSLR